MKKTMKFIVTAALVLLMLGSAFAQTDPNVEWKTYGTLGHGTRFNSSSAWDYEAKTDIEGKITEYATSGSFIIRCSHLCEVFFTPERYTLVDDGYDVLVKFNDKPAKQYGVHRSSSDTSYFFGNPISILRAIRDNGGYMTIQYKPYQRIPETVKYSIWNLPPSILERINERLSIHQGSRRPVR